ncbi:MAG: GH85 family endohexosaminidase C-terminal domain-containing protein [Oscillospiraceae bacterium]
MTLDEVIYPSDKIMEARVYWEKAEDAFMYRIYRTFADGHKEFVGATPSDALYLGSLDRDGSESACTFEITSYSENGVKGGTQTFSIDWPAEVENGFVPVHDDGPNLAPKRPAVANAYFHG